MRAPTPNPRSGARDLHSVTAKRAPKSRRPVGSRDPAREASAGRTKKRAFPVPLSSRRGLVCAGGGVTGAIYEIGALAAIEERLENASLCDFDCFVGVSAGSYVGTLVANGVSPSVLYRAVTRSTRSAVELDELGLFRLNAGEIARRLASAPITFLEAAWDFYKNRHETTLTDLVASLGQVLPSGIFQNEGIETWMRNWLTQPGRTDDFRKLGKKLRIVAVELDTGETVAFGAPGHDAVPISKAVQASCALPGLYKPVAIDGVDYIDGGVRKTAHISLALQERCGFVLCVNPIVPSRRTAAHVAARANGDASLNLARRGLPSILDQVFRVTLHSRMVYGMARYRREDPEADILVFEPSPEDLPRFMRNIMRTSGRIRIAEFAYRSTMRTLDDDFGRLSKLFAKHGLKLRPASPIATAEESVVDRTASGTDTPSRLKASLQVLEEQLRARAYATHGLRARS